MSDPQNGAIDVLSGLRAFSGMRVGPVGGYFGCHQITVCRRNVEKLSYYFEQFACTCAGDWTGHINDEERFRAFVHAAHQRRVKLTAPELTAPLLTRGFDREGASELADLYLFGRVLLGERPALN